MGGDIQWCAKAELGMTTICEVSKRDKRFMTNCEIRRRILVRINSYGLLDAIEDEYDARVTRLALAEYEDYLENGGRV